MSVSSNPSSQFSFSLEETQLIEALTRYEQSIDAKCPMSCEELCRLYPEIAALIPPRLQEIPLARSLMEKATYKLCDTERYQVRDYYRLGGTSGIAMAWDRQLNREVVLKVPLVQIRLDAKKLRLLEHEAELSAQLQHPNILPIYEKGSIKTTEGETLEFFAMRFLDGDDFHQVLDDRPSLDHEQLKYILLFQQVCGAVSYSHSIGIANGDLKPENVLIGKHSDAYVIDWGFAKRMPLNPNSVPAPAPPPPCSATVTPSDSISQLESLKSLIDLLKVNECDGETLQSATASLTQGAGTLQYMPPENWTPAKVDGFRADVFMLGGILAKIITGQPTYSGHNYIQQSQQGDLSGVIARISKCQADKILKRIALRCLQRDPLLRPADARQVEADIAAYVIQQETAKTQAEKKLRNWVVAVSLCVLLGTVSIYQYNVEETLARQQSVHFEAGQRWMKTGNYSEAKRHFEQAMAVRSPSLSIRIAHLRSQLPSSPVAELLPQIESLLSEAHDPQDKATLLLLRGDLRACDPDMLELSHQDLSQALAEQALSSADTCYAQALQTDDVEQCIDLLVQALRNEPFHFRAACLLPLVQLVAGRPQESERQANLHLLIFPNSVALQAAVEASQRIDGDRTSGREFAEPFASRLRTLQVAFAGDAEGESDGPEQLSFTRQSYVASSAAAFIRAIPSLPDSPGIPRRVFLGRARFWDRVSRLSKQLAPSSPLDLIAVAMKDRQTVRTEFEKLTEGELDGLILQMLAVSEFVAIAPRVDRLVRDDPDRLGSSLSRIERLQTESLARPTIAPRSQFAVASRVIRYLVIAQLLALKKGDNQKHLRDVSQQDFDNILSILPRYPGFIDDVCDVLMQTTIAMDTMPLHDLDASLLNARLRLANFWMEAKPKNFRPKLYRARIWIILNRKKEAITDIQAVLSNEPQQGAALQLLKEAEAMPSPT